MTLSARQEYLQRFAEEPILQGDDTAVWERFLNEPTLWYGRFRRFCDQGPKRSRMAVYLAEWDAEHPDGPPRGRRRPGILPHSWNVAMVRWRWIARAQAYDDAERVAEAEDVARVRAEEKATSLTLLRSYRAKLAVALRDLDAATLRPSDIALGLRLVNDELRRLGVLGDAAVDEPKAGDTYIQVLAGVDLDRFRQPPPAALPPPTEAAFREVEPPAPEPDQELDEEVL